jgi:hypothetical protein
LAGFPRLEAILFIGLAAAAAHGLLWALAEKLFGWNFGGGGGSSLPHGWSAAILSVTMTVPLVAFPLAYERLAHTPMVLPGHWLAGCFIVVFAALGHIFLYGTKRNQLSGVRNVLFPLGSSDWRRELLMESIYAVTHFSSIVLIYRVVIQSQLGPLTVSTILPALISGALWLSGVSIFIFLKYPDSLKDKKWIEVRGVLHALMLMVTLTGGMLM